MARGRPRKERPVTARDLGIFLGKFSSSAIYASGVGKDGIFGKAVVLLEGAYSKSSAIAYHRMWHQDHDNIHHVQREERRSISGKYGTKAAFGNALENETVMRFLVRQIRPS